MATDFGMRTQSVARGNTDAETDAISYQLLVRLLAPNLATGIAVAIVAAVNGLGTTLGGKYATVKAAFD